MSISRAALRIATVKALVGNTLADDRVHDSEIGPLEDIAGKSTAPIVVVYTDDEDVDVKQRDLLAHDGMQSLVIEIAVTTKMDKSGDWSISNNTDKGMELIIDLIEHQCFATLQKSESNWAEIWRMLAGGVGKRRDRRGVSAENGVRFAGRQILIEVELPKEPSADTLNGPTWSRFFEAAASEQDLAMVALDIRTVAMGASPGDGDSIRSRYGITAEEAVALGVAKKPTADPLVPITSIEQQTTLVDGGST